MILKFFKLFSAMIAATGIAFAAMWLLPHDQDTVLGLKPLPATLSLLAYCALVGVMFIKLSDHLFRFPPKKGMPIQSEEELRQEIFGYFDSANSGGKVFENHAGKNYSTVTWSGELKYNQVVSIGNISKKSVFKLYFNPENKTLKIVTTEKNINWSAGIDGFAFNLRFYQGIPMEYETTIVPSFEIVNGKPKIIVKNLTYNSNSILNPIVSMTNRNGWTAAFSMGVFWLDKVLLVLASLLIIGSVITANI